MATIQQGRWTATAEPGALCFIVGMRVNRLWRVDQWVPVALAMPKMLAEIAKRGDTGVLGRPRTMVSGRIVAVVMHWDSFESLEAYANAQDSAHLPAWRRFNKRARSSTGVGLFHETYVLGAGNVESLYVNMAPFGLGAAHGTTKATGTNNRARGRLHDTSAKRVGS